MKKCKYCQSEIDEKAKICPHCRKKQSHKSIWIILILLAFIIIPAVIGSQLDKNFQKEYKQNEIVTYKDVKYSIINVEKTEGSNIYFKANDGYEYVKVKVKIENASNKKISYNPLNFRMVNGDGVEASFYSITAEDDIQLYSGDLDAGGKVEGTIIWEQKKGDKGLRIRYYKYMFDNEYIFQWTLD